MTHIKRQPAWTPEMLHRMTGSFEPWLSCDGCFEASDHVVSSLLIRNQRPPEEFSAHLRGCGACREETETLAELVAADNGIEPALALASLAQVLQPQPAGAPARDPRRRSRRLGLRRGRHPA